MVKDVISLFFLLHVITEMSLSYPASMNCDWACFLDIEPGEDFGYMGIDKYGETTGANCVITTNIPAGGYTSGQSYVVTVTSTAQLARKLASDRPGFQETGVVNSADLATTSTHSWTADSAPQSSFRALCGDQVSKQMWVAAPLTVSLSAQGGGGGNVGGGSTVTTTTSTTIAAGGTTILTSTTGVTSSSLQLMPGMFLNATVLGDDIDIEVTMNENTWIGLGFSAGTSVSMTGDGNGVDLFACTGGKVLRYWMISQSAPTDGIEANESSCASVSGKMTMKFRRTLAAGRRLAQAVAVTPGTAQTLIYAHGESGSTTMGYHLSNRDGKPVDLQSTETAPSPTMPASTSSSVTGNVGGSSSGGNLELMPGMYLSATVLGDDIDIEVTMNENTWIGLGFSAGTSVSMTGDGNGVDLFACTDSEVLRYWMTSKSAPTDGVKVSGSSCAFVSGKMTMKFRRALAAGRRLAQAVEVTPGTAQILIFAHGESGSTTMGFHRSNRDGKLVDLQSLSTAEAPKKTGEATLYLHLIFMILSWGMLLPWGVALANRARNVPGAPAGAWFRLHRAFQVIGIIVQFFGFVYALWHCGQNVGAHFQNGHTIIGAIVIILGLQQPLNAAIRPHPPNKGEAKSYGRLAFEVIHKGSGYLALLLAFVNIWYGVALLNNQSYNSSIIALAVILALLGFLPVIGYVIYAFIYPDNGFSRLVTGATGDAESLTLNRGPVVVGNSKSQEKLDEKPINNPDNKPDGFI